jgi:hypothetical protein
MIDFETLAMMGDPTLDAIKEAYNEADNGLATLLSHADPLIQGHLVVCVDRFLAELTRLALEGPGDPSVEFYDEVMATASSSDLRDAVKRANINFRRRARY